MIAILSILLILINIFTEELSLRNLFNTNINANEDILVDDFLQEVPAVKCKDSFYTYDKYSGIYIQQSITQIQILVAKYYEEKTGQVYHVKHSRQIQELLKIRIPEVEKMEAEETKICLNNCVLDVATGVTYEHSPEFGFVTKLPVEYDADANCPTFDCFIKQICVGNKDRINTILEFMGLSLTRLLGNSQILVLKGNGANGKSTLLSVMMELLGEGNSTTLSIDELPKFGRCKIIGKKLAVVSELNKSSANAIMTNELKQIASGEYMDVNIKNKHPIDLKPYAKVILLTNHDISFVGDASEGALRRIQIVPMDCFIPVNKRDFQLEEKLRKELSGILNRAVSAFQRLRDNSFVYSSSWENEELINTIVMKEDPLKAYVRDNIVYQKHSTITYQEFTIKYLAWCKDNNIQFAVPARAEEKSVFSRQVYKEVSNYFSVEHLCSNGKRGVKNVSFKE